MRKPHAIKPGDTVAVVSPASAVERVKLDAAVQMLEDRGYNVIFGEHAFDKDGFLAGSDKDRAADLSHAYFHPDVKAVLCARGGYGCTRLLQHLDLEAMAMQPKLLVGFSDITTLHIALNNRGLVTLYGPMLLSFVKEREPWIKTMWFDAVEGTRPIALPKEAPRATTLHKGTADGIVTGGCLCLITDSIGTPNAIDAQGKIILIEDVDEPPHRVDAMLTHLLHAGILQSAAGIVVGEMTSTDTKIDEGIGGKPWREIVAERLHGLRVPIVMDFPFGHAQHMSSLPLGIRAHLDADKGELTYLELGVEA